VERVADECLAMVAGEVVAAGSYAEVSRQADIAAQLGAG
jgi:ABC-type branched-subunit amino acid transport system ATPase component